MSALCVRAPTSLVIVPVVGRSEMSVEDDIWSGGVYSGGIPEPNQCPVTSHTAAQDGCAQTNSPASTIPVFG